MNKPILVYCVKVRRKCETTAAHDVTWNFCESVRQPLTPVSGEVNMFAGLLMGTAFVNVFVAGSSYLIYGGEGGAGWRKGVVDKEEERFLRPQRHTLSNKEAQLPHWKEEGAETETPRSVSKGDTPKFHFI